LTIPQGAQEKKKSGSGALLRVPSHGARSKSGLIRYYDPASAIRCILSVIRCLPDFFSLLTVAEILMSLGEEAEP
jgi:hypothetical protein